MHPSIRARRNCVAALHARSILATADFYARIGRPAPTQEIRFQVVTKAKAYHIVELATGKTKGFCFSYRAAVNFAQALEAAATRKLVGRQ